MWVTIKYPGGGQQALTLIALVGPGPGFYRGEEEEEEGGRGGGWGRREEEGGRVLILIRPGEGARLTQGPFAGATAQSTYQDRLKS